MQPHAWRSPSLLGTLAVLFLSSACSDPEPKQEDMGSDMTPDMVIDKPDMPDYEMCAPPDDLSMFCAGRCGMQEVPCTDGEQVFDCGACDVSSVEILEPKPADGAGLVLQLGESAKTLKGRALDAQGMEVPCELQWAVTNDNPEQSAELARVTNVEGQPSLLPITQGKINLTATCEQTSATLPVQLQLPGYTLAPTAHKLWLRPEFGLEATEGKVSAWRNTITDHPDFIAPADREPSVMEAGLKGFSTLSFDGTQGLEATPEGSLKYVYLRQEATIFMVLKADQARTVMSQLLLGGCQADGDYQLRTKANVSNVLVYYHLQKDAPEFFSQDLDPTRIADGFVVLTVHADATSLRLRINGQSIHTIDGRVLGSGRSFNIANVGSWCNGMIGFQGQIAEVLGFEAGFGAPEALAYRDRIERYLLNKYGL